MINDSSKICCQSSGVLSILSCQFWLIRVGSSRLYGSTGYVVKHFLLFTTNKIRWFKSPLKKASVVIDFIEVTLLDPDPEV